MFDFATDCELDLDFSGGLFESDFFELVEVEGTFVLEGELVETVGANDDVDADICAEEELLELHTFLLKGSFDGCTFSAPDGLLILSMASTVRVFLLLS